MDNNHRNKITYFSDNIIKQATLPDRFTFPFYYTPHLLAKIAAEELQHYLETQANLDHNFGLNSDSNEMVIGKMFGVLIVQDGEGKIGYLSAFSGKLAKSNDHPRFVPPVFDMLVENSFFLKGIEVINVANAQVEEIERDGNYIHLKDKLEEISTQSSQEIATLKEELKTNKVDRSNKRKEQKNSFSDEGYATLEAKLIKQSLHDKHRLKILTDSWQQQIDKVKAALDVFTKRIDALKTERKERSAALQQQLFEQYIFLNKDGNAKNLQEIFSATAFGKPPSAAGECATPKLLQYAFLNGYKPLAMAEFWWGASPKSEIRKHKQFYPACTGKCKPILAHMLEGMLVDENPFLQLPQDSIKLHIVYEDDYLIVINKPSGLRSVPGIEVIDSVYSRLKRLWNNVEALIIHRLDMDTSGLLVVAKMPQAHAHIQRQFLKRTVSKRYTALLMGIIDEGEGEINLPLRLDPFNRPRQLVCFESGKKSTTKWKVVERKDGITKIHFWPLTGRTHQLRVHAAHQLGLNAPIVGDDLYGVSSVRLCLHAAYLAFMHPVTGQALSFEVVEEF